MTSTISELLARYDVNVLDVGQAVIHDTLTLGMVVEVPSGSESSAVLKDVLFACHELGMAVRFEWRHAPGFPVYAGVVGYQVEVQTATRPGA